MSDNPSPLEKLMPEILSRIGSYAARNSSVGPPVDLLALASTSRRLYDVLSFDTNKHLWGKVFEFIFDFSAIERRLGERWTTSRCLAEEGHKRYAAINRIRKCVVTGPHHIHDLWTAYLMMLESDGKNESLLIDWADIRRYLYHVILYKAQAPKESPLNWFSDTEGASLTLWLMWMTASPESIRTEHPHLRVQIRALLHPFVVAGYKFPSIMTPDSHFYLPLCESEDGPAPFTSGPPPSVAQLTHYGHHLTISSPSLTSAALLGTLVRVEAVQDISPLPAEAMRLPQNRAAANALGITGQTLEDVQEFHYRVRTRYLERSRQEKNAGNSTDTRIIGSSRHDEEWHRLVCCYDLWTDQPTMRGKVYTPGTLSGYWDGRSLIPIMEQYMTNILNPQNPSASVGIGHNHIAFELQEHHCLSPNEPLYTGTDEAGFGDDILNAYFPKNMSVKQLEDAVEIHLFNSNTTTRYDTFYPDKPLPYSKDAWSKLQRMTWSSEDLEDEDEDSNLVTKDAGAMEADRTAYIDDDDEYEDTVTHEGSGVTDILITGKTSARQGDAWGHFSVIGRVRPWDGLCVLLRIPTNPQDSHLGRWIFKGYVHDDQLVGRCRETSTNTENIGWEGGFVMCKS